MPRDLEKELPDVFEGGNLRVIPGTLKSRTVVLCLRSHLIHTQTVIHLARVVVTICLLQIGVVVNEDSSQIKTGAASSKYQLMSDHRRLIFILCARL